MTRKSQSTTTESIELNLEDTISDWSQVIEDAMAAVDSEEKVDSEERAGAEESLEADSEDSASQDGEAAATAEEEAPPSEAEKTELRMQKERLEAECSGLRDRLARTLADFENFRKRSEREKDQIERFALTYVLRDFLGVFDNLERALAAEGSAEDLKQGVDMIARQFVDVIKRHGVEPVKSTGQPFDPKVHEAVASTEGTDVEAPTVTDEHQRGYVLHDRLLRPAMVTVAMPAPKPAAAAEADPEAEGSKAEAEEEDGGEREEAGEARETMEEPAG